MPDRSDSRGVRLLKALTVRTDNDKSRWRSVYRGETGWETTLSTDDMVFMRVRVKSTRDGTEVSVYADADVCDNSDSVGVRPPAGSDVVTLGSPSYLGGFVEATELLLAIERQTKRDKERQQDMDFECLDQIVIAMEKEQSS